MGMGMELKMDLGHGDGDGDGDKSIVAVFSISHSCDLPVIGQW